MNNNQRNTSVLIGTLAVCGGATFAGIRLAGISEASLGEALRLTAQLALLIYLLIFVARPLQVLRRGPVPRRLMRNRRYLGIAFAAVMTVHLALILWLKFGVTGDGLQLLTVLLGVIAYAFIFLMLITSWDAPARALGPRYWKRLHTAGLYWIGLPFLFTMLLALRGHEDNGVYIAFVVLMAAAIFIRIAGWFRRRANAAGHARIPSA